MNLPPKIKTPLDLAKVYWPSVYFPPKNRECIMAVKEANEVDLVAANGVGKDFQAGFISTTFFLWPQVYYPPEYVAEVQSRWRPGMRYELIHQRRGISTSVAEKHLKVLWGEISKFIETCRVNLVYHPTKNPTGPLVINDFQLSFATEIHIPLDSRPSYFIGMVAEKPEKFSGHHAPYTLFMVDEGSGMENKIYERAVPWTRPPGGRRFIFGNAEATDNFFKINFRKGDLRVDEASQELPEELVA